MAMPKGNCEKVCNKNANGQNDVTQVPAGGGAGVRGRGAGAVGTWGAWAMQMFNKLFQIKIYLRWRAVFRPIKPLAALPVGRTRRCPLLRAACRILWSGDPLEEGVAARL